jgi:hypothetical protein
MFISGAIPKGRMELSSTAPINLGDKLFPIFLSNRTNILEWHQKHQMYFFIK